MKRVFEIDVLVCPYCEGKRALIAFISDGFVVRKILDHLGLDSALQSGRRRESSRRACSPGRDSRVGEERVAKLDECAREGVRAERVRPGTE